MTPIDDAVKALRGKIEHILTESFGTYSVDADGDIFVDHASARVFVCPRHWRERQTVVSIFSVTNVDVPVSGDLTAFLAQENLHMLFGHFALRADEGASHGSVWLGHTLLGDFLDAEELVTALSTVARLADAYDDRIRERFGGRLYTEGNASGTTGA